MSYWLVAAPANDSKEKTLQACKAHISAVAHVNGWTLPGLKVGTLDSLMQLSDDLLKIDLQVEGIVHKIERDLTEQFGVTDGTLTVKNDGKVGAPERENPSSGEGSTCEIIVGPLTCCR